MTLRPLRFFLVLAGFSLAASGCLLLSRQPLGEEPGSDLMPALVAPQYQEERQPTPEQLQGLDPEERATYVTYRAANRGVVNITSLNVAYNWFL
jgi:hypothetical protein